VDNKVRFLYGVQDFMKGTRQVVMVLDNVIPSLVTQPYGNAIDGMGNVHVLFSTESDPVLRPT
jgi:hypothetical protein